MTTVAYSFVRIILKFHITILCLSLQTSETKGLELDNYGPYSISWRKVEMCRNFKQLNTVNISAHLSDDADNNRKIRVNFNLSAPIQVDVIKMSVYTEDNHQKNLMWHYNMKKPCQHFALSLLLIEMAKNRECIFRVGTYSLESGMETMRKLIGDSFFYRNYIFRTALYAKKANVVCLSTEFSLKKKV